MVLALLWGLPAGAQNLTNGDVAVVGYQSDAPDVVVFVALTNIPASAVVHFTDNGWSNSPAAFRPGEGLARWVAPGGGLSAGTVVAITNFHLATVSASAGSVTRSGSSDLATAGDQVIAYQTNSTALWLLFALTFETDWAAGSLTANTSQKPSSLPDAHLAVLAGAQDDDGRYNRVLTNGTKAQLLAAITNASNWTSDGTPMARTNLPFTVTAGAAAPDIAVRGNNVLIADGDTTPDPADHTDFGNVGLNQSNLVRTFSITNGGTASLTLQNAAVGGAHASDFAVVSQPASPVAAGATTSFQIRFDPSALGARSATVYLTNNVSGKSPYDFAIQGTGRGAGISNSPASLSFSTTVGVNPAAQTFGLTNIGLGRLDYAITTNGGAGWLSVSPGSGTLAERAGQQVTVSVNVAGLSAGTSNATLVVADAGATNTPRNVAVTLVLTAGPTAPSVATTILTLTNDVSAAGGGNVTGDGGATVTNRGVAWSTASPPTVSDSASRDGADTGPFSSTLSNLVPGQAYVYRAYAQNSIGTAYGTEYSFAALCFTSPVTGLFANPTNSEDFTANWSARAGATSYRLDVSPNGAFAAGGAGGTNTFNQADIAGGTTSSYLTRDWTNAGVHWVARKARIDRTVNGSDALTLQDAADAFLETTNIAGGIGSVRFIVQQQFSGSGGQLQLFVNGTLRGTIPYDTTVQTASVSGINAAGVCSLMLSNNTAARPAIDDLVWTGYGGGNDYTAGYSNRTVSGTSQAVTGLAAGTVYYYRVRPVSAACTGGDSATASVTTVSVPVPQMGVLGTNGAAIANGEDAPAPAKGTDFGSALVCSQALARTFTITNSGGAHLVLTAAPAVALSGHADFAVTAQPSPTSIAAAAGATFEVTFDPQASGARTCLVSIANNDAPDNPFTFSLAGTGAGAGNPTSLAVAAGAACSNRLTWMLNAQGDGIVLAGNSTDSFGTPSGGYSVGDTIGSATVLCAGAVTAFTDTNVAPGATGYYRIWSRDACGAYSAGVSTNRAIACSCLDAPAIQAPSSIGDTFFTANWGAVPAASGYQLDASTNAAFATYVPGYASRSVAASGQPVTGLTAGVTYHYRVRAVSAGGCVSGNSGTQSATTTAGADVTPPGVTTLLINGAASITDDDLSNTVSLTVVLQDAGSGLKASPAPSFAIHYPTGGMESGSFSAGYVQGTTAACTVTNASPLNTPAWPAGSLRVVVTAADVSNNTAAVTNFITAADDDPDPPVALEFTMDGVGGTGDTNLLPGAIAIIGVNGGPSQTLERFSFVVLAPFPAGTVIDFTDCGWNPAATNWHRTTEFHSNRWVAAGDADVGQVFELTITNLNSGGDQVAAYQYFGEGSPTNNASHCVFVYAINMDAEDDGWDLPPVPNDNEHSGLYNGLTNGWTAVSVPDCGSVNCYYTGRVSGAASELLAAISDSNNWYVAPAQTDLVLTSYQFTITGRGILQWDVVTLTDQQVRDGGYRITNVVQDLVSGLSTNPPPYFRLANSNGLVIVSNQFAAAYLQGSTALETLSLTAGAGAYANIVLGEASGSVVVADADADRPDDAASACVALPLFVEDDDGGPPVLTGAGIRGSGSGSAPSGTLLSYSFGTNAAADLQPDSIAENLSVSNLATAAAGEPATVAGSPGNAVSDSSWTTASSNRWRLILSAGYGYGLTLTNLAFDYRCSGTGPTNWFLAQPLDGYAAPIASGTLVADAAWHSVSAALSATSLSGTAEWRLAGSGASSGAGTWRIDNLVLQGVMEAGEQVFFVTDADLFRTGVVIRADAQDEGHGIYGLAGAHPPAYTIKAPGGSVLISSAVFDTGPASNGAAKSSPVALTGMPAFAWADIVLGAHTVLVSVTDCDDDRPGDGAAAAEACVMHVGDDDSAPPQISVSGGGYLYFEGKSAGSEATAVTDGDLADGLSFSNRVYDVKSGILGGSAVYRIFDPAGPVAGPAAFDVAPGDGEARTNTYAGGGLIEALNVPVDIASRTLGVWTARISVADSDNDRPGDGLTNTQDFAFYVVDDDRVGPRMTNVTIAGGAAVLIATGFENLDGWATHAAGDWTEDAADGPWVASNMYANTLNGRGGTGRNCGMNDAGDSLELPAVDSPGRLFVWACLSGAGTADLAAERLDDVAGWTGLGTRTLTNTAYDVCSWTVDRAEAGVRLRLRMTQYSGRSIYFDDLALTRLVPWTNWSGTVLGWTASSDAETGNSGISAYRVVAFGGRAPVSNDEGSATIATSTAIVTAAEGVFTGYVYAVDNDGDRGSIDRSAGIAIPFLQKIDHTAPLAPAAVTNDETSVDITSEIRLRWVPPPDAGGADLSPWRTYRIHYTEDGPSPSEASPFFDGTTCPDLTDRETDTVVLSNLLFDTEYRLAMVGFDEAGNASPLSAVVTAQLIRFSVTQGVVHAAAAANIAWTATNRQGEIVREFDLLYCDAMDFSDALSNQWRLLGTVQDSHLTDSGSVDRASPGLMVDTMRFYRASHQDRWLSNRNPRVASVEVYGTKALRLYRGQNWVAAPLIPDDPTLKGLLGHSLPAADQAALATKVNWYARTNAQVASRSVWLCSYGGTNQWLTRSGFPTTNTPADGESVALTEGFVVEIPTNAAQPPAVLLLGLVPTNRAEAAIAGAGAYNLVGSLSPVRAHPSQMGLLESGFRGSTNGFPTGSDRMWSFNRATQRATVDAWYDVAAGRWRLNQTPSFPDVPPGYFKPDDAIVILTHPATPAWTWTNRLLYSPPTREMSP